jgi:hypothetical protein
MFCPNTGKKVIRNFGVDATPPSPWRRGTGPHTPEAYAKTVENNRKHFKNKPKSAEQREKMRQAKLGKKFTKEHCAKIAKAWEDKRIERRERNQEAMRIAMSTVMGTK